MTIIGIDLGTTNSAVAYLKNGVAEIIANKDGHRTTPSIFSINPHGEIQIGRVAKNAYPGSPNETVLEVKRLMGSGEKVVVSGREFTPEEISSYYLKYLKESAESALGYSVAEAIITVPAYFSDAQRKATQIAGRLAGLKVERVINEPTAAAIAFGINNMNSEANILVYDLGGGTFDVSIVDLFNGIVQVKASTGDNKLGGMDFDNVLVEWLNECVKQKEGIDLLHSGSQMERDQRYARIKTEAENVKITLSSNTTAQFSLPFITMKNGMPVSVSESITREEFNSLIQPLVDKSLKHVRRALEEANLQMSDISDVLLVGGSTRVPYVQQKIEQLLGKPARTDINPDEAVALGAAIQGGIKSGEISNDDGLMVVDVCPYSLGIDTMREIGGQRIYDFFSEIIPANSPIPYSNTERYYTIRENQTQMDLGIYQGDGVSEHVKPELRVTKDDMVVKGIPASPEGEEAVDVTFSYDINGMLHVEATIVSTGRKFSSSVNTQTGVMSEQEIAEATRRVEQNWEASNLYVEVKGVLTRAERILPDLLPEQQARVASLVNGLKQALADNNVQQVKQYETQLADLLIQLV
ncbi:MAG: Hsp70 family protein [Caryophanon sp.]|nr:Hsp70 family protein [Caryophanon sp.]